MAKATVTRSERVITLELSEKEAALVLYLTGHVVTGWSGGPRDHADEIYKILTDLGVSVAAVKAAASEGDKTHFNAYPEGFK